MSDMSGVVDVDQPTQPTPGMEKRLTAWDGAAMTRDQLQHFATHGHEMAISVTCKACYPEGFPPPLRDDECGEPWGPDSSDLRCTSPKGHPLGEHREFQRRRATNGTV